MEIPQSGTFLLQVTNRVNPVPGIRNRQSRNPESKTVLSSLTWDDNYQEREVPDVSFLIIIVPCNLWAKDYYKADSGQRILFFHNNISAGHTNMSAGMASRNMVT